MKQSKDSAVVASARLLEQVIGPAAENIGRMTRVGVTITRDGVFKLVRLSDPLIALAQRSLRIYKGRWYARLIAQMQYAHKINDLAKVAEAETVLRNLQSQIDALDAMVRAMKQADSAAVALRGQEALARATLATREVADLAALSSSTPATLDALFVANATLSLNLQIARQSIAEMDSEDNRMEMAIKADAAIRQPELLKAIDDGIAALERQQPGARAQIESLADDIHRKRLASGETE
jgi:hypothetical protein